MMIKKLCLVIAWAAGSGGCAEKGAPEAAP